MCDIIYHLHILNYFLYDIYWYAIIAIYKWYILLYLLV